MYFQDDMWGMLGKLAVVVFEGPVRAFACREGGKRFSGRNRTGYFLRPRESSRWTRRLNLCRLIASVIRHLSSRRLCPYTSALNPFLTDVFQSELLCAQFLLRIQVFSNYRTKSCAIDTEAGYAKKIITETTKKHSSVSPRKWRRPCSLLLIFNSSVRLHLLLFVQVCKMIGIILECLNSYLRMNM